MDLTDVGWVLIDFTTRCYFSSSLVSRIVQVHSVIRTLGVFTFRHTCQGYFVSDIFPLFLSLFLFSPHSDPRSHPPSLSLFLFILCPSASLNSSKVGKKTLPWFDQNYYKWPTEHWDTLSRKRNKWSSNFVLYFTFLSLFYSLFRFFISYLIASTTEQMKQLHLTLLCVSVDGII